MVKTGKGSAVITLPSDTEMLITRDFDAPRHLVFKAWTTPELVKRWWHANRGTVTIAEVDLRPGGKWRSVMIADGGFEVGFHGEYSEVLPNEKLVYTEVYEGAPPMASGQEDAAVNHVTFADLDGRTRVTVLVVCSSKETRDAIINSGMEGGMQDAYDLLEALAKEMA